MLALFLASAFVALAWAATPSTLKRNTWTKPQIFKHLVREWELPGMAGWTADSDITGANGDIDGDSTPEVTIVDNIPCIVWDAYTETMGVLFTRRLPPNYHSGLTLYFLVSSDAQAGTPSIDAQIWVNREGDAFQTIPYTETAVASTLTNIHTTNDILEMVWDDSDPRQMFEPGDWVTIEVFNANASLTTNTELKGIAATYNADR